MGVIYRKFDAATQKFVNTEEEMFDFSGCAGKNIIIGIDGSSSRTGIAVAGVAEEALFGTMAIESNANEDYVRYKVRLKQTLKNFMDKHLGVLSHILYEEPFIGFTNATKVLMTIRTTVKEIMLENAPKYDSIKFVEVNNQRWKHLFLFPDRVPNGTDNQKIAVQQKIVRMFGEMVFEEKCIKKTGETIKKLIFTEDECDSIGLCIAGLRRIKLGLDVEELKSKSKAKPFKYKIQFLTATAENQDEAELRGAESFFDYNKVWKVPQRVVDNGIELLQLNGRGLFDKQVFEAMGQEDKLLIVSFKGGNYVDVILRNQRSDLCRDYASDEYIIAFIWRVTRK